MRLFWTSITLALLHATTDIRAQDAINVEAVERVKEATVFLRVVGPAEEGRSVTGTGFLVGKAGKTGLVATNAHVVAPGGSCSRREVEIDFRSGTKAESQTTAEVVAIEEDGRRRSGARTSIQKVIAGRVSVTAG